MSIRVACIKQLNHHASHQIQSNTRIKYCRCTCFQEHPRCKKGTGNRVDHTSCNQSSHTSASSSACSGFAARCVFRRCFAFTFLTYLPALAFFSFDLSCSEHADTCQHLICSQSGWTGRRTTVHEPRQRSDRRQNLAKLTNFLNLIDMIALEF